MTTEERIAMLNAVMEWNVLNARSHMDSPKDRERFYQNARDVLKQILELEADPCHGPQDTYCPSSGVGGKP